MKYSEDVIAETRHVINLSGGKDSTACLILAMEEISDHSRLVPVFADTGNEHDLTYQHIDNLESLTGLAVNRLRVDLAPKFEVRRRNLPGLYRKAGISEEKIERALAVMHPSGNPFLDMCLLRGGFPGSVKHKFCTSVLKIEPIKRFLDELLDEPGVSHIWQWVGIRRDESRARVAARRYEVPDFGVPIYIYRPLVDWSAADVFAAHERSGVPWNPLYQMGMSRVGCMPCINVRKLELREIANRFPEHIDRIREWEVVIGEASKQDTATFLPASNRMSEAQKEEVLSPAEIVEIGNIDAQVAWSRTSFGGRQYELSGVADKDIGVCDSWYGLCE